jgi:transcriptional regulator with XRE-family HTH domain
MSIKEFAKVLGVSTNCISAWENGYREILYPKILEYALKYILNINIRRRPVVGLASKLEELQKREQKAYEDAEKHATREARKAKAGTKRKGNNSPK